MVTQRKENEWARKEAERLRREKQHGIQQEKNRLTHQKYVARVYAKGIIHGMRDQSFRLLEDQGLLRHDLELTLRDSYMPYLLRYANRSARINHTLEQQVTELARHIQTDILNNHARVVQAEFDRRQQILNNRREEAERLDAEKRQRRERRRLLRIFYAKKALRGTICPYEVLTPRLQRISRRRLSSQARMWTMS